MKPIKKYDIMCYEHDTGILLILETIIDGDKEGELIDSKIIRFKKEVE